MQNLAVWLTSCVFQLLGRCANATKTHEYNVACVMVAFDKPEKHLGPNIFVWDKARVVQDKARGRDWTRLDEIG